MAEWRQAAACRGMDTRIFYPAWKDLAGIEAALAICGPCPVRPECAAAGAGEDFGIWGGLNVLQRGPQSADPPRERLPSGPRCKPIEHGTVNGWTTEFRRGIPHCEPCRLAKNAKNARLRAKKRTQERVA